MKKLRVTSYETNTHRHAELDSASPAYKAFDKGIAGQARNDGAADPHQRNQQIMNIKELYLISVLLNFLPIVVMTLFFSMGIGLEYLHGGHAIYFLFFITSSIINLSFFLLKIKSVRNNKVRIFFASYASSLFFLILALCLIDWDLIDTDWYWIKEALFFSVYFFTNFLLVLIYRIKNKNQNRYDRHSEK